MAAAAVQALGMLGELETALTATSSSLSEAEAEVSNWVALGGQVSATSATGPAQLSPPVLYARPALANGGRGSCS